MSERRAQLVRATLAADRDRAARLWLLRPGQRELWHAAPVGGPGRFVVRHGGRVEQSGVRRASACRGVVRRCGAVRLHTAAVGGGLVVVDAIEAAYADRCRTAEAGAYP